MPTQEELVRFGNLIKRYGTRENVVIRMNFELNLRRYPSVEITFFISESRWHIAFFWVDGLWKICSFPNVEYELVMSPGNDTPSASLFLEIVSGILRDLNPPVN